MADDNVPPNPSTPPPPTSDHEVADRLNSIVENLDIPDLEDTNFSGSPDPESCSLILTEGDSSDYFDRGSSLIGKNNYSVLPLKGKLLNVREATTEQLLNNIEIQSIMKVLGLRVGKIYQSVNPLRYGHLMIVANKDDDGLHMIGLLINFLHYFWSSLLQVKDFMRVFITPIVQAVNKETNAVLTFHTLPEYEEWVEKKGQEATKYKINYFKGPETLESERAEFYDEHIKDFVWSDHDGHSIEMAFSRKTEVINQFLKRDKPFTSSALKEKLIPYSDFINIDFKQYLAADLRRSIPSMVDGLKPAQRTILFYAFKKPIIKEIEVAQFSAYVFEHSPNDHGDASLLDGTIIGMAQNYVGSNNINLLQPNGQFGTRLMGGKDHVASGSCLFTKLSSITRYLFHKDDKLIIHLLKDKDAWIPIIPMVLVNGSEGRGVGCSSFIPNYNPRDIIANLKRLIKGKKVVSMRPWYQGFTGDIQKEKESKGILYTTKGSIEVDKNVVTINELPVGTWTQDYEEFLEKASRVGEDIKVYTVRKCNIDKVDFEVTMTDGANQKGVLLEKLRLTTILSTANMHVLNEIGDLKKYDTPEHILEDFFHFRLELYEKRMTALIHKLAIASRVLGNKVNFINKVLEGEIAMFSLEGKEGEWCHELKGKHIQSLPSIVNEVDHTKEIKEDVTGYDYLLSTPIGSFTYEKIEELKKEMEDKKKKCDELRHAKPESLWIRDLNALDSQLEKREYPLAPSLAEKRARPQNAAGPQREKKNLKMTTMRPRGF